MIGINVQPLGSGTDVSEALTAARRSEPCILLIDNAHVVFPDIETHVSDWVA